MAVRGSFSAKSDPYAQALASSITPEGFQPERRGYHVASRRIIFGKSFEFKLYRHHSRNVSLLSVVAERPHATGHVDGCSRASPGSLISWRNKTPVGCRVLELAAFTEPPVV